MKPETIAKLVDLVVKRVGAFVDARLEPLHEQLATMGKALEEIPAGKDGADGEPGADGLPGEPGQPGADGKSYSLEEVQALIAEAVARKQAEWALDFERRAHGILQQAIDRMPKPIDGKDGRDALAVDKFHVSLAEDGRTMTFFLGAGDDRREASLMLPVVLDRGVFKEAEAYARGDAVTFGGSLWIAQKNQPEGKPGLSGDWRLAVKKGRDGKDGAAGRDYTPPAPVKLEARR